MHYESTFAAWLAAGGVSASVRSDDWADTLLGVLGDLDSVIASIDLGLELPEWARGVGVEC
jgi:hypothetical protein